jgi:hypothetical protein
MDLAKELETWFQNRPLWLQDAASKLLNTGILDEQAYNDLLKICGSEAGIEFEENDIPKAKTVSAAEFTKPEHAHKIEIISISNITGINALNPRTPLIISDQFTTIYGQNGTGKSGYTRLLKQVCGAKSLGQLHPNTFKEKPVSQSCEITYKVNGTGNTLISDASQGVNEYLSTIELYDHACGSVYVTNENELAYEPEILKLFSELTIASDVLSTKLDDLANELDSQKLHLPNEYANTKFSQWHKLISAKTTAAMVDQECSWNEEDLKNLDSLRVRLKEPDPKLKAEKIRKSKKEVDKLIAGFRSWEGKLSDEVCIKYNELHKDYLDKQSTASNYAKSVFENSPLKGVGEEAWSQLWECAKLYSEILAYPNIGFPNVEKEVACVLCQQSLDD